MTHNIINTLFTWPICSLTSIIIAFGLLLLVTFPSNLVVNEERMRAYEREIKVWEEAKRRAITKKDRKLYTKVLRRETRIRHLREEIDKMRLKASGISLVIWLLTLNLLLREAWNVEVVYFPLMNVKLTLVGWYFVLSFWLYPLTTRITRALSRSLRMLMTRMLKKR